MMRYLLTISQSFSFTTEGSDHWWKRIENWHKDSTRIIDVEEPESPLTEDLMEDYFSW